MANAGFLNYRPRQTFWYIVTNVVLRRPPTRISKRLFHSYLLHYKMCKIFTKRKTKSTYLSILHSNIIHGVQRRMFSVDNVFGGGGVIIFCCVVAICVLVHDVETIFRLSYVPTASGNLF